MMLLMIGIIMLIIMIIRWWCNAYIDDAADDDMLLLLIMMTIMRNILWKFYLLVNPSKNVGRSYDHKKWDEQKHEAPLFHDAATNLKTLPICNRSHDKKHSVNILFKSVKKCGRNSVHKKLTELSHEAPFFHDIVIAKTLTDLQDPSGLIFFLHFLMVVDWCDKLNVKALYTFQDKTKNIKSVLNRVT